MPRPQVHKGMLGKKPKREDKRNIKFSKIKRTQVLGPLPQAFDIEAFLVTQHPNLSFPGRMWKNDLFGDCVKAYRANQQRIFEAYEQGLIVPMSDNDVERDYFIETGGPDDGLVVLDSLNDWRQNGWRLGAKKRCFARGGRVYKIYAFAELDLSMQELMEAIYYLKGACVGIQVPQYALDQFNAGQPWDVDPNGDQTIQGGHCIQLPKFDQSSQYSLECWTWATRQPMTPAFLAANMDEAYGVIQLKEPFVADSPVDDNVLANLLQEITTQ